MMVIIGGVVGVFVLSVLIYFVMLYQKKKKELEIEKKKRQGEEKKEEAYNMGEVSGQIQDPKKKFEFLQNLRREQTLKIWGRGDLEVSLIHTYRDSDGSWLENVLISSDGKKYYFEAGKDDEGFIELTISQKIKMRQLTGINKDKLEEIWDKGRGYFIHDGKRYDYDDDYKVQFIPDLTSSLKRDNFELIEFCCDEDSSFITFEAYEEGHDEYSYEVAIGEKVRMDEIEIGVVVK